MFVSERVCVYTHMDVVDCFCSSTFQKLSVFYKHSTPVSAQQQCRVTLGLWVASRSSVLLSS